MLRPSSAALIVAGLSRRRIQGLGILGYRVERRLPSSLVDLMAEAGSDGVGLYHLLLDQSVDSGSAVRRAPSSARKRGRARRALTARRRHGAEARGAASRLGPVGSRRSGLPNIEEFVALGLADLRHDCSAAADFGDQVNFALGI